MTDNTEQRFLHGILDQRDTLVRDEQGVVRLFPSNDVAAKHCGYGERVVMVRCRYRVRSVKQLEEDARRR